MSSGNVDVESNDGKVNDIPAIDPGEIELGVVKV
jgi:hypothetical protein